MRIWLVATAALLMLVACTSERSDPSGRSSGACVIGGCSAEVCSDHPTISPCIWRAVFVCYEDAVCGRQIDGTCGWNATPELRACVADHPE
jgi:hypothetical protein